MMFYYRSVQFAVLIGLLSSFLNSVLGQPVITLTILQRMDVQEMNRIQEAKGNVAMTVEKPASLICKLDIYSHVNWTDLGYVLIINKDEVKDHDYVTGFNEEIQCAWWYLYLQTANDTIADEILVHSKSISKGADITLDQLESMYREEGEYVDVGEIGIDGNGIGILVEDNNTMDVEQGETIVRSEMHSLHIL